MQLAAVWGQKKEYDQAIVIMEEMIQAHPRVSSKMYTMYVSFLEKKKAFSKALDVLLKAGEIFPENTDILFYRGFLYDQIGQTEKSIKQMKKSIKNRHQSCIRS